MFGADASSDISSMANFISSGDNALSSNDYNGAVSFYQQAGNLGATVIGPEIDSLSGGNPSTTNLTHDAWTKNGILAAYTCGKADDGSDDATSDTAVSAQNIVNGMLQSYRQALSNAQAAPAPIAPKAVPKPSAPTATYTPSTPSAPATVTPVASTAIAKNSAINLKEVGIAGGGAAIGWMVGGPIGGAVGGIGGFLVSKILKV